MNRRRFLVVAGVMALGAAVVFGRSLQITVFEHDEWSRVATKRQRTVINVPSLRGTISSSDGYVLATSVERMAIQVDTQNLEYPKLFARAAAPLLGVTEAQIIKQLDGSRRWLYLAKRVPRETAEQVRALATGAVGLVPDFARIYPQGHLAAPVVGFVGHGELEAVGRSGFEHHYDAYLSGEPEQYLTIRDAIQRRIRLERLHRGRDGYDLQLTLIARLQARSEAALERVVDEHGARAASAVVVDVQTGDILAMASLPSFDPASAGKSPPANWRLRPVQDALEPGSTVKPVVAAAALSEGVVRDGELFDCTDRGTRVAGHWVRDHASPGMYTLDEVVVYSANVGIIEAAERVREEMLWQAFSAFGFGRRSGIDFPAEARGLMPETRSWSKMSPAGFALGQELTTSPLQIAMAYAAIANGGWLVPPRLVVSDVHKDASLGEREATRVLDEGLALRLRTMLEGVVTEGTGELARVPGFRVAGKTGTAQRAVNGTFDDIHHTSWFAGFLPMPDPRVVIVVAVEDPVEKDFWASTVAAPIFAEIAGAAVNILDLPPTAPVEAEKAQIARREPAETGGAA